MTTYSVVPVSLRDNEESIDFDFLGSTKFSITPQGIVVSGTINGLPIEKLMSITAFIVDALPPAPADTRVVFLTTDGLWYHWGSNSTWVRIGLDWLEVVGLADLTPALQTMLSKLDSSGNYTGNITPSQVVTTGGVSLDTTLSGIASKLTNINATGVYTASIPTSQITNLDAKLTNINSTGVYTASIPTSQITNLDAKLTNINATGTYSGTIQSSQIEGALAADISAGDNILVSASNEISLDPDIDVDTVAIDGTVVLSKGIYQIADPVYLQPGSGGIYDIRVVPSASYIEVRYTHPLPADSRLIMVTTDPSFASLECTVSTDPLYPKITCQSPATVVTGSPYYRVRIPFTSIDPFYSLLVTVPKLDIVPFESASALSAKRVAADSIILKGQSVKTALDSIATKAPAVHTHAYADITDKPDHFTAGRIRTATTAPTPAVRGDVYLAEDGSIYLRGTDSWSALGSGGTSGGGGSSPATWATITGDQSVVSLSNFGGELAVSRITALQTALNGKAASVHFHDETYAPLSHTHVIADVTGLQDSLDAKATGTHNHDGTYAPATHSHTIANVTGLQTALDGKASSTHNHDGTYASLSHTHAIADVTGLQTALDAKASSTHNHDSTYAPLSHTHVIADVSGLQTALDAKASSTHTHVWADITDKPTLFQSGSVRVLSTAPSNPTSGDWYYDTALSTLRIYVSGAWTAISGGTSGGGGSTVTDPFISATAAVTLAAGHTGLTHVALESETVTVTLDFGAVVPTGVSVKVKADSQSTTDPFLNATGTSTGALTMPGPTFTFVPSTSNLSHTATQNHVWYEAVYTVSGTQFTRSGLLTDGTRGIRLYPQGTAPISAAVSMDSTGIKVNNITDWACVFAPSGTSVSYTASSISLTPTLAVSGSHSFTAPARATLGPSTCPDNAKAVTGLTPGTVYTAVDMTLTNPLGVSKSISATVSFVAEPLTTVTAAVTLASGHAAGLNYICRTDEVLTFTISPASIAANTVLKIKADSTATKANDPFTISSTTATAAIDVPYDATNGFQITPSFTRTAAQNYVWWQAVTTIGTETFTYSGLLKTTGGSNIRLYTASENDVSVTFTRSATALPMTVSLSLVTIRDYLTEFSSAIQAYTLSSLSFTPSVTPSTASASANAQGGVAFGDAPFATNSTNLGQFAPGVQYTSTSFNITNALGVTRSYTKTINIVISPLVFGNQSTEASVTLGSGHAVAYSHICREDEKITYTPSFSVTPTTVSVRIKAGTGISPAPEYDSAWANMTANENSFEIIPSVENLPHTAAQNYVFFEVTNVYLGVTSVQVIWAAHSSVDRTLRLRLLPQGDGGAILTCTVNQTGLSGTDLQTKCVFSLSTVQDYLLVLSTGTSVSFTISSIALTPAVSGITPPTTAITAPTVASFTPSTFSANSFTITGLAAGTTYTSVAVTLVSGVQSKTYTVPISLTTASASGGGGGGGSFTNAQSVQFNGTSQYSSLAFSYDASPWSISFWVKILSIPTADNGFVIDGRGGVSITNNPFYLHLQTNTSVLRFASDVGFWLTSSAVPLNTWKHFVITSTGSASAVYEDGDFKSNITTSIGSPIGLGFGQLTIASRNGGTSGFANIRLDEMSLWNISLNATKISEIWNGGVPGDLANHSLATNNLQGWWRFSGNGNDSSGKNRHLNMAPGITYSTDVKT